MIYEPREDSFILKKYVELYAYGKVLDMGTGSGIQAQAALKKTQDVLAADINPEAVKHVQALGIRAIHSDLFSNIKETFDVIIFNPPYLPHAHGEDEESQQITTGGAQGYEILESFLKDAQQHLNPRGIILLVYSSLTGNIEKLAKKYHLVLTVVQEKKIFFETLIVAKVRNEVIFDL
ncbi:MAG TPA: HemK2/MTQ2 family protein methyltransferase [Candidatus Nanoarchaeia archaeon]|nr:HemK2/MTQ2 family protein methyltransferase [Candidatus Nanoarchaeia archaeon]